MSAFVVLLCRCLWRTVLRRSPALTPLPLSGLQLSVGRWKWTRRAEDDKPNLCKCQEQRDAVCAGISRPMWTQQIYCWLFLHWQTVCLCLTWSQIQSHWNTVLRDQEEPAAHSVRPSAPVSSSNTKPFSSGPTPDRQEQNSTSIYINIVWVMSPLQLLVLKYFF